MPTFSTQHLPNGTWREYRKKVTTVMVRIDGPFTVETSEGPLRCEDGYLALDARGYPYPIAADEQALIYELVDGQQITVEPNVLGEYRSDVPGDRIEIRQPRSSITGRFVTLATALRHPRQTVIERRRRRP